MAEERGTIRSIAWREVFPWLLIFRSFSVAISLQILLLSTIAVVGVTAGWRLIGAVTLTEEDIKGTGPAGALYNSVHPWPSQQLERLGPAPTTIPQPSDIFAQVRGPRDPYLGTWSRYAGPFGLLLGGNMEFRHWIYIGVGLLWTLVMLAFFGGAVTRSAAVQLAREQRLSLGEVLGHARRKFISYFTAPLVPALGAILLIFFALAIPGLLMNLDFFVVAIGFVWFLGLLVGLVATILLLGLAFGWPLMWGTIATEGSDSFDALSRSYAYTFVRPLHYLFFAVAASLFGVLCMLLVTLAAQLIVGLSLQGEMWFLSTDRASAILNATTDHSAAEGMLWFGGRLIRFWNHIVLSVAAGFSFAFFFSATAAIYLLLRRSTDQTELDEVYLDDEAESYGMPPLRTDAAGVPGVADVPPPTT